jgi:hypothetical protein
MLKKAFNRKEKKKRIMKIMVNKMEANNKRSPNKKKIYE